MKKLLFITLLGFLSFSFKTTGDNGEIVKALKTGNAEEFAKYFDSFVDMKLLEKEEVKNMSKNQASIALKIFFSENNIKGFELASQREMSGTMYMTGKLQNAAKGFNITLMIKIKDGKSSILSIRIS